MFIIFFPARREVRRDHGRGTDKRARLSDGKPLNSLDCYTGVKGSIPFLPQAKDPTGKRKRTALLTVSGREEAGK